MSLCLIGLGSNLGDRQQLLEMALGRLQRHSEIEFKGKSGYRETLPAGGPPCQSPYLNAAAVIETSLPPKALLTELQTVENELGRQRKEHWGSRTVDLDLLLYGRQTLAEPDLVIPHPRMAWRRFVLEPAAEVAPDMVHPSTGWTISRLLARLNETPWYLAVAGSIGVGKSRLAGEIAEKTGAWLLAEKFNQVGLEAFCHNPSSHAWQIELEFLEQRARMLNAGRPEWLRNDRPAVSDFCFAQSPVLGGVWLPPEHRESYQARWEELRATVVQPRLTVLLYAPIEAVLARILARGRYGEDLLTKERLQQIANAVESQVGETGGPVLRLDASDNKTTAIVELAAAMEAMR
jgi:2-amino-4-hydroxy-6-hydroxymethyldihydropteridine diphosphokinase